MVPFATTRRTVIVLVLCLLDGAIRTVVGSSSIPRSGLYGNENDENDPQQQEQKQRILQYGMSSPGFRLPVYHTVNKQAAHQDNWIEAMVTTNHAMSSPATPKTKKTQQQQVTKQMKAMKSAAPASALPTASPVTTGASTAGTDGGSITVGTTSDTSRQFDPVELHGTGGFDAAYFASFYDGFTTSGYGKVEDKDTGRMRKKRKQMKQHAGAATNNDDDDGGGSSSSADVYTLWPDDFFYPTPSAGHYHVGFHNGIGSDSYSSSRSHKKSGKSKGHSSGKSSGGYHVYYSKSLLWLLAISCVEHFSFVEVVVYCFEYSYPVNYHHFLC
jgi:hypothetical protein